MDRPDRFANNEYNSHEDSLSRPQFPADASANRAWSQKENPYGDIDLHDLNDWLRRPRPAPPPSRQDTEDTVERPEFTVKEPDSFGGFANNGPRKSPQPTYDQNFLHPPTPSHDRESFMNVGLGTARGGGGDDDDTVELRPKRLSVNLEQSSRFGWWTLGLLMVTVILVTLTAIYADGSVKSLWQDKLFTTSQSNAILILRVMTEICALLLGALIMVVVEDLQWALASRPQGVGLLHFVGLDSGTGVWGLLRLLATADWNQKYSSLFRLLVICSIPLPGIVLMGDISLELVFFPQKTYAVSAGIGRFNASYISWVDDSVSTALLVSMGSSTWSTGDTWNAIPLGPAYGQCTHLDGTWSACDESRLLVGGVLSISPQRDNLTGYPDSKAYVVPKTRSLQLEYGTIHDLDSLYTNGTCYLTGSSSAASYWCTDTGSDEELLFGSSYCPLAIQAKGECFNDTSWSSPLQIASSLFVYSRYATVSYSRTNFSILSVTDLTAPEREVIKLEDYMLALSAMVPAFNPSTNSTNTTMKGDNSALATYAVTALPLNDNEVAKRKSLLAIRKAMSVPLNYFHANYFSDQSIFELTEPRTGLSEDMYTTLSISILSHQVVAGRTSRWLFGLLCGLLLAFCAVTMVATVRICGRRPERCGYPTLDFAAMCAVKGGIRPPTPPNSLGERGGGGGGGGGGLGGGLGDGGEEGKEKSHGGLYRSLTSLGHKPTPFQVARRIKNERIMLGKY